MRLDERGLADISLRLLTRELTREDVEELIEEVKEAWFERDDAREELEGTDEWEEADAEGGEVWSCCDGPAVVCAEYDIGTCRPAVPFV